MAAQLDPITSVLDPQYEQFAGFVSEGYSYREAARRAGFHEQTAYKILKNQDVRERINELVEGRKREDLSGIASRGWIESRLLTLADELERGMERDRRADALAQVTVLMSLARLKGYVVERSARVQANLSAKVDAGDVTAALDALEPGARTKLLELADGVIDTTGA